MGSGGLGESLPPIRVLIADDHPLMREAISDRLKRDPEIDVVAHARSGPELVEMYPDVRPDVVITDYSMPGGSGVEAVKRILEFDPDARIVIVSAFDDQGTVVAALEAGAVGYVSKSSPGAEILKRVKEVAKGRFGFDSSATRRLVEEVRAGRIGARSTTGAGLGAPLSHREIAALRLVAEGLSNSEIAQRLQVSIGTAKTYLDRAYVKLGVADRAAAVREAMRAGYLR